MPDEKTPEERSLISAVLGVACMFLVFVLCMLYFITIFSEGTDYIINNYPMLKKFLLICSLPFLLFYVIIYSLGTADAYSPFSRKKDLLERKQNKILYYSLVFVMFLFLSYNAMCVYVYYAKIY